MSGANLPQQHVADPSHDYDNNLNVNYWALYGQPQYLHSQMHGGVPLQQNFYKGSTLDQPMHGNIHYEGHILPDYNQNAYAQQCDFQQL